MNKIKLAIVDDSELYIDALKVALEQEDYIEIIFTAGSGEAFLQKLASKKPDITLIDIQLPGMNGIEATIEALKIDPALKVIAITMHETPDYYKNMEDAGGYGYLLKKAGKDKIVDALNKVYTGCKVFTDYVM